MMFHLYIARSRVMSSLPFQVESTFIDQVILRCSRSFGAVFQKNGIALQVERTL